MGAKSRSSLPGLTRQSIHFVTFLQRRWMRGSSPRMTGWTRLLRQFDDLVHALDGVIDRDLNERMLFLDPQSRRFRGFVGRIRAFRLPIHLEAKSAAVRRLALRDPLRNGFLRRGGHGYGLGALSRWRHHLMISLCCRFLVVAVTDVYCAAASAERRAIE